MAIPIETHFKRETQAIVMKQLLGVLLLSLIICIFFGQRPGISTFVGGMAYSLPDLLFVRRFIRYTGIKAVTQFMSRFFVGKMAKLALRSILIVFASLQPQVDTLWLIVGFVSCAFLFWAACMMHFSKPRGAV